MRKNRRSLMPNLIFLCLITTSIATTSTMSRYKYSTAGNSGADVAVFVAKANSVEGNPETITLDCKNSTTNFPSAEYEVTVTNTNNNKISEVGMKYSIVVTSPTTLPEWITITVSDAELGVSSDDNRVYTFKSNNTFLPGVSATYTSTITFSANNNLIGNHTLEDIKISVVTEQIN